VRREVHFSNLLQIESQKGQNFKTLWQNNTVLRRAALSEQKPRWIELVKGLEGV
jgi:hypothetical protein